MDFRQIVSMARVLELMRAVRQGRSLERLLVHGEAHAAAAVIRDLDPADTAVVARLLRLQVRLDLILGRRLEDAESSAALAVCVVVEWAVAVEAHLIVVGRAA